jgi:hypothetical protein
MSVKQSIATPMTLILTFSLREKGLSLRLLCARAKLVSLSLRERAGVRVNERDSFSFAA